MIFENKDGSYLKIFITPNASRNEIVSIINNEIKIKISSPPIDGKANKELTKFLAKVFAVSKSQVFLSKGLSSRHKLILIKGSRGMALERTLEFI